MPVSTVANRTPAASAAAPTTSPQLVSPSAQTWPGMPPLIAASAATISDMASEDASSTAEIRMSSHSARA